MHSRQATNRRCSVSYARFELCVIRCEPEQKGAASPLLLVPGDTPPLTHAPPAPSNSPGESSSRSPGDVATDESQPQNTPDAPDYRILHIPATSPSSTAGTATTVVESTLGLKPQRNTSAGQTAIGDALGCATQDQLLALKNAANDFAVKMQALGFQDAESIASLAEADRASARVKSQPKTPRLPCWSLA